MDDVNNLQDYKRRPIGTKIVALVAVLHDQRSLAFSLVNTRLLRSRRTHSQLPILSQPIITRTKACPSKKQLRRSAPAAILCDSHKMAAGTDRPPATELQEILRLPSAPVSQVFLNSRSSRSRINSRSSSPPRSRRSLHGRRPNAPLRIYRRG